MTSPFISSFFPSFLLLTSIHNKCNPLALTLLQPIFFFFLQLSLRLNILMFSSANFLLPSACPTHLMSSPIKRHGWQMVGLKTLETSLLNELFHQVEAGIHVCHKPNNLPLQPTTTENFDPTFS